MGIRVCGKRGDGRALPTFRELPFMLTGEHRPPLSAEDETMGYDSETSSRLSGVSLLIWCKDKVFSNSYKNWK